MSRWPGRKIAKWLTPVADFFAMGGYGAYICSAYAVFIGVLAIDAIAPRIGRKRVLADIRGKVRRRQAREPAP